jgi:hypothetical protein
MNVCIRVHFFSPHNGWLDCTYLIFIFVDMTQVTLLCILFVMFRFFFRAYFVIRLWVVEKAVGK